MHLPDPTFPPLITGHPVKSPDAPFDVAVNGARTGELGAGDLVWSKNVKRLDCALVLEPDVPRSKALEILQVGMVAFADALGAIAPPELGVLYRWPNKLRVNGGDIGEMRLAVSDENDDAGAPHWMVLDIGIQMSPEKLMDDPGEVMEVTNLFEEGCGDINRTELLESYARHLLTWIHNWSSADFPGIQRNWLDRAEDHEREFELEYSGEALKGTFLGLDEIGNLLMKVGRKTRMLEIETALGLGAGK